MRLLAGRIGRLGLEDARRGDGDGGQRSRRPYSPGRTDWARRFGRTFRAQVEALKDLGECGAGAGEQGGRDEGPCMHY